MTKNIKFALLFASKTYMNPQFRCFFLYFAQKTASQKFSIWTSVGRCFVAKWPIWWLIRGNFSIGKVRRRLLSSLHRAFDAFAPSKRVVCSELSMCLLWALEWFAPSSQCVYSVQTSCDEVRHLNWGNTVAPITVFS